MTYHMRDMKRINQEAEERDEAIFIAWITVFYAVVAVLLIWRAL